MWIIDFLPEFMLHWFIILGALGLVASFFLKIIPGLAAHRTLVQVVSTILLCFGLWIEGGLVERAKWKARVSELEIKLAQAEVKSEKVNTQVVEKIVYRDRVIREKGKTVTEYIDREVVKTDSACVVSPEAIKAHNAAALNTGINGEQK